MSKILLVDDELAHSQIVSQSLTKAGYETEIATDGQQAIDRILENDYDFVLLDIRMPRTDGVQVLSQVRQSGCKIPVVMLSAFGDIETAVQCMKLGATEFIEKPVNIDVLIMRLRNIKQNREIQDELNELREMVQCQDDILLGESTIMLEQLKTIDQVAQHDITVMIRGESGTGKELTAKALHYKSRRNKQPFVSVDCASLPETLVESELFGYEKGAFTGAHNRKPGRFEQVGEGTLFLDEIGNLPLSVQVKLLRVLQERVFTRLGGKEELEFKATVITATNVDLENAIREGVFREDLYYRINEFMITLPPLRNRHEDIPLLVKHFLATFNKQFKKEVMRIHPEVMGAFMRYPWPGNVRELKNIIKRAVVLADDMLELKHLPETFFTRLEEKSQPLEIASNERLASSVLQGASLKEVVRREVANLEGRVIREALEASHWNRTVTAKRLDIDYKTLYNKMKEYGID
jgi:DNA-binding NtrC family response regulator